MPDVRSAWVLDERVFGFGRYADGGMVTVSEAALLRPALVEEYECKRDGEEHLGCRCASREVADGGN